MRLIAKNKTHTSLQLQTVMVAVSVVQFHMTTRLIFMLVSLTTSKTSKYPKQRCWHNIDVSVAFDTCHGLASPFTTRWANCFPLCTARIRGFGGQVVTLSMKKNPQWIQLSGRRQNTSPLSIRMPIGRKKTFCTARVTQPILFRILPKIVWDSLAL